MAKRLKHSNLLLSVLYLAFGIFLIADPALTISLVCGLIGGVVVLNGILQIIRYLRAKDTEHPMPFSLWFGILCVALGVFLLVRSDIVVSLLPIVFGLFVVCDSIPRVQNAIELRRCGYPSWMGLLVLAAVSVGLGVVMILNPFATVQTLVVAIGVILTLEGLLNLFSALYTGVAVRRFSKRNPKVNEALEKATGIDLNGDGIVAAPVADATVEGKAREVEGEADIEAVPEPEAQRTEE